MNDDIHTHDIFISYSRKNKDAVLPIKDEMERLGLTCWIDLSDIPCGVESFKKKVIPGIKQTRVAFLFFLSTESQSSEYAMKEINFAKKRANKRVILVRFNDDEMTDEFYFDFQDTDIIDWRVPEQKAKLLRDLCDSIGNQFSDELTNMSSYRLPSRDVHRAISRGIDESCRTRCNQESKGMKMGENVYIITVSAILLGGAYLLAKLFVWWAFER